MSMHSSYYPLPLTIKERGSMIFLEYGFVDMFPT